MGRNRQICGIQRMDLKEKSLRNILEVKSSGFGDWP